MRRSGLVQMGWIGEESQFVVFPRRAEGQNFVFVGDTQIPDEGVGIQEFIGVVVKTQRKDGLVTLDCLDGTVEYGHTHAFQISLEQVDSGGRRQGIKGNDFGRAVAFAVQGTTTGGFCIEMDGRVLVGKTLGYQFDDCIRNLIVLHGGMEQFLVGQVADCNGAPRNGGVRGKADMENVLPLP